jgi:hypothetical protein
MKEMGHDIHCRSVRTVAPCRPRQRTFLETLSPPLRRSGADNRSSRAWNANQSLDYQDRAAFLPRSTSSSSQQIAASGEYRPASVDQTDRSRRGQIPEPTSPFGAFLASSLCTAGLPTYHEGRRASSLLQEISALTSHPKLFVLCWIALSLAHLGQRGVGVVGGPGQRRAQGSHSLCAFATTAALPQHDEPVGYLIVAPCGVSSTSCSSATESSAETPLSRHRFVESLLDVGSVWLADLAAPVWQS